MPSASVFRWIDGNGILVLAPGTRGSSDIRAEVIGRSAADGALVCAIVNGLGAAADALLDDFEQLGATSGYVVDLITEDDATIETQLGEASIIVIESGKDIQTARSALLGAAERGIRAAYARGAVVLAEGLSALLFGRWVMREDHTLVDGLNWLSDALVVPTTHELSQIVKPILQQRPFGYAVGIGGSSALALEASGQVTIWGEGQIAVTLGRDYGQTGEAPL
jgi:hypothetical protein